MKKIKRLYNEYIIKQRVVDDMNMEGIIIEETKKYYYIKYDKIHNDKLNYMFNSCKKIYVVETSKDKIKKNNKLI